MQKRIREYFFPLTRGSIPRLAQSHCFGVRGEKKGRAPTPEVSCPTLHTQAASEAGSDCSATASTRHNVVLPSLISYRQPFEL